MFIWLSVQGPGQAVAAGVPLTVRLLVPLWVVNATALPIAVTATKLAAQREKRPSRQDSALDATAVRMKELSTDAQPNFRCLALSCDPLKALTSTCGPDYHGPVHC